MKINSGVLKVHRKSNQIIGQEVEVPVDYGDEWDESFEGVVKKILNNNKNPIAIVVDENDNEYEVEVHRLFLLN